MADPISVTIHWAPREHLRWYGWRDVLATCFRGHLAGHICGTTNKALSQTSRKPLFLMGTFAASSISNYGSSGQIYDRSAAKIPDILKALKKEATDTVFVVLVRTLEMGRFDHFKTGGSDVRRSSLSGGLAWKRTRMGRRSLRCMR